MEGETVRETLKSLAGIAACTVTAALLSLFLRDGATIRLAAPLICIQVVILTALCGGRWPALIGAVMAGFTFALLLYPPYGSLWVHDPGERIVLTIFQLIALGITQISPRSSPQSIWPTYEVHKHFFSAKRKPTRTSGDATRNESTPPASR